MGDLPRPLGARRLRRITALLVGVGLVVVSASLALMMAHGAASRDVAANARALHRTNSVLGSAAVARAGNAQAVVFGVDHHLGVAGEDAFETAIAEGWRTLEVLELAQAAASPGSDLSGDIMSDLDDFVLVAGEVLTMLEAGEIEQAVELSEGDFEESYSRLEADLISRQTDLLNQIDATEGDVGRTASLARTLVTLMIPATALFAYFVLARRQMRERRIEMQAELQAAQELAEAKDQFIAGLSHELRTPLTSIYGFSEVLMETGLIDHRNSLELIALINHESADLSRMVEDLLTAARLEAGALSIDISPLVLCEEIDMVLEPFRRTGTTVTLACPPILVRGDRLRLRQVIRNLVSNAVRHGGPRIHVEARAVGDSVVTTVIDNGPGVPAEIEDRLFQRYVHQGREALLAGSVGLGLAIARALVEAMDGTIRYHRVEDHSVFSVSLPKAGGTLAPSSELGSSVYDLREDQEIEELTQIGMEK